MICKNCGKELPDNVNFCTNCGAKVDLTEQDSVTDDEHTLLMLDEETAPKQNAESVKTEEHDNQPPQVAQDENRTMVMWDDEPEPSQTAQPSPVSQDENRTMVMWDDEPESSDSAGIGQSSPSSSDIICINCGATNSAGTTFCVSCGAMLSQSSQNSGTVGGKPSHPSVKTPGLKKGGKKLFIGLAAAVVVVAVVVLLIVFKPGLSIFGGKSGSDEPSSVLTYAKDDELYIYKGGSKPGEFVTDDDIYEVMLSGDGKYVYYLEQDRNGETGTLMYKKLGDKDDAKELDDDIDYYGSTYVLPNGSVLYIKNDKLYLHNLKEAKKVASGVSGFNISRDDEYVWWWDDDDTIVIQDVTLKKDKIEIKDVYSIEYVSDDMSDILYTDEDGNLYHSKGLKDGEKVDSDVTSITENDGKIYYYREEKTKELSGYDLAKDDSDNYDVRNALNYMDFENTKYTVCEYDLSNKKSKDLVETETLSYEGDIILNAFLKIDDAGEPIIIYPAYDTKNVFKMSDAEKHYYDSDIECYVRNQLESVTAWNAYYKGKTSVIAEEGDIEGLFTNVIINNVTDELYIIARDYEDYYISSSYNKLYVSKYKSSDKTCNWIVDDFCEWKASNDGIYYVCREAGDDDGELYLNGVEIDRKVYTLETESKKPPKGCFYYKDYDSDDMEASMLFYNGKKIIEVAQDVREGYIRYIDDDSILYCTDYDDGECTLCRYKNGKSIEISEDVYLSNICILNGGNIAYIKDWSDNRDEGDLYVFNGKKSIAIDTDVTGIGLIYY